MTLLLMISLALFTGQAPKNAYNSRWLEGDSFTDYSQYSCHNIYEQIPQRGSEQCQFAKTCNGGIGVWAPIAFCSNRFSTNAIASMLSPVILLWLVLLFRMLSSTAEDFFSPSLEMFSVKLGLPPRFAGVSLLALGNGAADVSATVSAINGDPVQGYKLSLGALTGASMFISGVISAVVVLAANGVPCRGALVRDVTMLSITVATVWTQLSKGSVGPDTMTLFLALYICFVVLVLVADVYHRAVVVPRLNIASQQAERDRQFSEAAQFQEHTENSPTRTRLSAAITALSNYDNEDLPGWGTGVEGDDLAADRPITLRGCDGLLQTGSSHGNEQADQDGYTSLDVVDQACVDPGSLGLPASGWAEALSLNKEDIIKHTTNMWDDIVWNGDLSILSKLLLLCELPFMLLRKVTIPIPCDGYYVRGMVALSIALSPPWFAFYLWRSFDLNMLEVRNSVSISVYWIIAFVVALAVVRFAPGGEGSMSLPVATPIALYGFVIAATWIDTIADALVSLLNFIGIILRIPGPIIGLTILAWGNSMSDLSANVTLARKGLGNMAMTACFAGPVFNTLVGLGLGFGSLAAKTGKSEMDVSLSPSITTGFVFLVVNSVAILAVGLYFGKGRINKTYGYVALSLYTLYLVASIVLQYRLPEEN